jgi:hypothetical protein
MDKPEAIVTRMLNKIINFWKAYAKFANKRGQF